MCDDSILDWACDPDIGGFSDGGEPTEEQVAEIDDLISSIEADEL